MENILLNPEFQTAIANILLVVVTGVVGAIAKAVFSFLKANTSAKQFELLEALAAAAVQAAEQGAIAGFVADRKATAINIVNEGLKNAGIKNLSAEQIDAAIEAAVINAAGGFAETEVQRSVSRAFVADVPEADGLVDDEDTDPAAPVAE